MVLVVLTAWTIGAWWTKASTVTKIQMRLQQLSVGRIFTAVLYPGESDFHMSPKQWSLVNGPKIVSLFEGEGGGAEAEQVKDTAATVEGEGEQAVARNIQTPGTITVSGTESETNVEYAEEMVPMQPNMYGGGEHGGYVTLDTDGYKFHEQGA